MPSCILSIPDAPVARCPTDRPLGRDVDTVRESVIENCANLSPAAKREPDFGVSGTGQSEKARRLDDFDFVTSLSKPIDGR